MREVAATVKEAARGEVRALDEFERDGEVGARVGFFFLQQRDGRVQNFSEIVWRDVGRHAYRNAGRPIDDEVRNARGEHGGLGAGLVVVGREVDGVGVDVGEHFTGEARHARFGVAHGGGWVAVNGAEVSLAVDHGVALRKILREADHGVVDGGVAVWMVVAHDVADYLGGLGVLLVELQAHFLHAEKDAAMHGLEAVARIRQRAADDDGHGVVEIRTAHLVFDIDGQHDERARAGGRGGAVSTCSAGGRIVGVRVLRAGRIVGVCAEGERVLVVLIICHVQLPL